MNYTITAVAETCTGHRLLNYDGKCAEPHGHNYLWTAKAEIEGQDAIGMSMDFSELKRLLRSIVDQYDHGFVLHRNDPLLPWLREQKHKVVELHVNPTAENLAHIICAGLLSELTRRVVLVRLTLQVQETRDSTVSVTLMPGTE